MNPRLLALVLLVFSCSTGFFAQGVLRVGNTSFLKVSGAAFIKLDSMNLDVAGSFSAGAGTVEFQGVTSDATISAAQLLVFNNLVVNKFGKTLQFNTHIQADGNVTFTAGMVELNNKNLTLGQPGGILINETEASHITGLFGGKVILTTSLSNPNANNPGNIGVSITSSSNLGATTIQRGHIPLVLPVIGNSVNRYFDVSPTNNTNLNATLRFNYFDSELNGLSEPTLNLFRQNGSVWESGSLISTGMQTRDGNSNFVQMPNLEHLSTWRLAACGVFTPTITGSASFCIGGNTPLDAGAGFAQYLWSNAATTQTILVNSPNTYTVTVSDANGCTGTASMVVTENTALSPMITGPNVLCVNGTIPLDAGSYSSYLWSNNSTTQSIVVNMAGTYSVTVTDANGCTGTDTQVITPGSPVLPNISGNPTFCIGNSTTLDAGSYSSYLWSNNSTTQGIVVNMAGTYSVIVTDANGCTGTDSQAVNQSAPITPIITGSATFCLNGSTVLDAGSGFASYSWSNLNLDTTRTITVSVVGTYTVTVTDANGCTGTDSQVVNQTTALSPTITGQTAFCPGGMTDLNAGSGFATYKWSNAATTSTITVNTGGLYTVEVSDNGGCTGTASVQVSIHPAVTANAAQPDTLDCNTSQLTLMATGPGLTFKWATSNGNILSGSTSANAIVDEAGDYQLIATSPTTGCTGTASVVVVQTGTPISGVTLDPSDANCYGNADGQIVISNVANGTSPFQYALGANGAFQTNNTFNQLSPGQYIVRVKGADNCITQQTVNIDGPDSLFAFIDKPDLIKEGEMVNLEPTVSGGMGPFSYQWEGPAMSCTDCAMPTVNPIFSAIFSLTVTDANNCTALTTVLVEVDSDSGTDIITPGDDDGANDTLTFTELEDGSGKYEENDIVIFNRWGQVVYKAAPYKNEWNGVNQNGKELPEGTYYYVLLLRDGVKNAKFGNVLIIR